MSFLESAIRHSNLPLVLVTVGASSHHFTGPMVQFCEELAAVRMHLQKTAVEEPRGTLHRSNKFCYFGVLPSGSNSSWWLWAYQNLWDGWWTQLTHSFQRGWHHQRVNEIGFEAVHLVCFFLIWSCLWTTHIKWFETVCLDLNQMFRRSLFGPLHSNRKSGFHNLTWGKWSKTFHLRISPDEHTILINHCWLPDYVYA